MFVVPSAEPLLTTLRVLAVLGCPAALDEVAALVGSDVDSVAALLAACDAITFTDDRKAVCIGDLAAAQAVLDGISPCLRAAVEGQVGAFLAEQSESPRRVAAHLSRAGRGAVPTAIDWLRRAGTEAILTDPAAAADTLERASALAARTPRGDEILDDLLDALLWLGRFSESEAIARQLLTRRPDGSRAASGVEIALRMALEAESDAGDAGDAAIEALRTDRPARWALQVLDRHHRSLFGATPADRTADEALALLAGTAAGAPAASLTAGFALLESDAPAALAALREGRGAARRAGVAVHEPLLDWTLALACFVSGHWDTAAVTAGATDPFAVVAACRRGEDALLVDADSAVRGRRVLDAANRAAAKWARCIAADVAGDVAAAADCAAATAPLLGVTKVLDCVVVPDLVRVLITAGRVDGARALVAEIKETGAADAPASSVRAAVLHGRGLVGDDPVTLEESARGYAAVGWRVPAALALGDAAVGHATRGDVDYARAAAKASIDELATIGAHRSVQILRRRLRDLGVRVAGQSKERSDGTSDLTAAEERVARLVADGMSNRDVAERLAISRYTVDAHLRRIFTKVGVSSRAELAARMTQ